MGEFKAPVDRLAGWMEPRTLRSYAIKVAAEGRAPVEHLFLLADDLAAIDEARRILLAAPRADGSWDGVRADLRTSASGQGGSLPGTIRKCAYLGNHLDIMVETEVGELFVVQYGGREMLEPGTAVSVSFAKSGVTLIPPT